MSRQLEADSEDRKSKKNARVAYILDEGLDSSLDLQGIELVGFAFKYDAYSCLMTVKAVIAGVRSVAFVGSDTPVHCVLKAYSDAQNDRLSWAADRFHMK